MSDRPIQVGDLVQIVRGTLCCGHLEEIGKVFRVQRFEDDESYCPHCLVIHPKRLLAMRLDGCCHPMSRLKRIPPMGELEGQRTEESLRDKEPA